jgi:uncharacterized radical SAM superfamily protein
VLGRDITLIQPPRPGWVQKFVKAAEAIHPAPTQDILFIANQLRARGYDAGILNADLYNEDVFIQVLKTLSGYCRMFAFFVRFYRISSAHRAVAALEQSFNEKGLRTFILGFLPPDFRSQPLSGVFDNVILSPSWDQELESLLNKNHIEKKQPLPMIADLHDFEELVGIPGEKTACIIAPSLLCPHKCTFCEHQILKHYAGNLTQPRKIEEVLGELKVCFERGAQAAVFLEGNFLSYPNWTRNFASGLRDCFHRIPFAINTRLTDINKAENDGTLFELVQAGLVSVCSGLESADDTILSRANKNATVVQYLKADGILKKFGVKRFYNFIVGLPGETEQTIRKTWDFIKELQPDGLQVSAATPFPGTPMHNLARQAGWIISDDPEQYYYYGSCVMDQPNLSGKRVLEFQKEIYSSFKAIQHA